MMEPASVAAWCTGLAGIITAVGVVVRIVLTRPRLPVAEELLEQLDELRADLLALARWAHNARTQAAAEGVELPDPPDVLRSSGRREGERRHDDAQHGWRSAVTAQQLELGRVQDDRRDAGPATQPDRRRVLPPPTTTTRG